MTDDLLSKIDHAIRLCDRRLNLGSGRRGRRSGRRRMTRCRSCFAPEFRATLALCTT
jgi:hypothetical protein